MNGSVHDLSEQGKLPKLGVDEFIIHIHEENDSALLHHKFRI